jgi:hypothetical protein
MKNIDQRIRDYWLAYGADIHVEVIEGTKTTDYAGNTVRLATVRSNLKNGLPPGWSSRQVPLLSRRRAG